MSKQVHWANNMYMKKFNVSSPFLGNARIIIYARFVSINLIQKKKKKNVNKIKKKKIKKI